MYVSAVAALCENTESVYQLAQGRYEELTTKKCSNKQKTEINFPLKLKMKYKFIVVKWTLKSFVEHQEVTRLRIQPKS